ncbi:MAG TPA: ester cyclase [Chloroflexia bacterium]|nr:ester cyclase [Chloroflexia bacterium]
MSVEANKAIVRRFLEEAWNQKNPAVADELLAPTYVYRSSESAAVLGPAESKQLIGLFATAFPDAAATIEGIVAEADQVAVRWTIHATHQGDFGGLPPTGKRVVMVGMEFFRLEGGQIVERWSNSDTLGLLQQLGVVSPVES